MSVLSSVLHIFFPTKCIFCGTLLLSGKEYACLPCMEHLPIPKGKRCDKCGRMLPTGHSLPICLECRKDKYPFFKVYAPFFYEGVAKRGIIRWKFRGKRSATEPFTEFLYRAILREGVPPIDFVTAVPPDPKRKYERGYHPCEMLAVALAGKLNVPYMRTMKKKKGVKRQSTLKRSERKKNIKNAFSLLPSVDVNEKYVLLVDDVFTTGATAGECAKVLTRAGAKEVNVAVEAVTPRSY